MYDDTFKDNLAEQGSWDQTNTYYRVALTMETNLGVMSLVVHSGSRDQLLTRSSQNEATESVA
ncbi:hypothetical protein [Haladaptatus sp. NG-WS-4]